MPVGSLDPDQIHLPGIYVHRLVQGVHEKRIEQRTTCASASFSCSLNLGFLPTISSSCNPETVPYLFVSVEGCTPAISLMSGQFGGEGPRVPCCVPG